MVFLIFFEAIITKINTVNEPKLAAKAILQLDNKKSVKIKLNKDVPKIKTATPKLAPELIPNTKGPAKGFRNKVCINKPLIPNPDPTIIAVNDFGKRYSITIYSQEFVEVELENKMLAISFGGIETEPKEMFSNQKKSSKKTSKVKIASVFEIFKSNNYLKMQLIFE